MYKEKNVNCFYGTDKTTYKIIFNFLIFREKTQLLYKIIFNFPLTFKWPSKVTIFQTFTTFFPYKLEQWPKWKIFTKLNSEVKTKAIFEVLLFNFLESYVLWKIPPSKWTFFVEFNFPAKPCVQNNYELAIMNSKLFWMLIDFSWIKNWSGFFSCSVWTKKSHKHLNQW